MLKGEKIKTLIATFISAVVATIILVPFLWLFLNSFKYFKDIVSFNVFGGEWTLNNYFLILFSENESLLKQLLNSLIYVAATLAIVLPLSVFSGYGLARAKLSTLSKGILMGSLIFARMVPAVSIALPYYVIFTLIGLYDTYLGLIIVYTIQGIPLAVFMMMTFIEDIPKEIEEAAEVDGASLQITLSRIVFPLILPGIAATAVFTFIYVWNDYLFVTFLAAKEAINLQVAIAGFNAEYFIRWGELSAAVIFSSVPVIIFAILTQKWLIRGLTLGAIKG
jgi:multiple sugar transport system permease protein